MNTYLDDNALKVYRKRARELHQCGVEKPRQQAYVEMIRARYPTSIAVQSFYSIISQR